jgi:hypothetical protein
MRSPSKKQELANRESSEAEEIALKQKRRGPHGRRRYAEEMSILRDRNLSWFDVLGLWQSQYQNPLIASRGRPKVGHICPRVSAR